MTSAKHLDESLSNLRSEIHALDVGDEEARGRLDRLVLDIGTRARNPYDATTDERLTGQLKASILNFEMSHPRLAVLMNDVLEKLSVMGI
jgi:Domain of unknown function (DUF4404)